MAKRARPFTVAGRVDAGEYRRIGAGARLSGESVSDLVRKATLAVAMERLARAGAGEELEVDTDRENVWESDTPPTPKVQDTGLLASMTARVCGTRPPARMGRVPTGEPERPGIPDMGQGTEVE